jgi:hypothetical protein
MSASRRPFSIDEGHQGEPDPDSPAHALPTHPNPSPPPPVTRLKYGKVAVLVLFSAVRTAVQSALMVVMSLEVIPAEVTAAASAL